MKPKEQYNNDERLALIQKYREKGEGSCGSARALKLYRRGIKFGLKSARYDAMNYAYYYDYQEHYESYERKGLKYFEKAADYFRRSAELGNDLAMMNYAVYLFDFKKNYEEALKWFVAASEAGLAVADYELAVFYKKGYCGVEINEEKANIFFDRYKQRCEADERQLMLAWNIDDDWTVINRFELFRWVCGHSTKVIYDTPSAKPSRWRYQ